MFECDETLKEMYAFLDHEMVAERGVEVQHHISECPDCLGKFAFHVELREMIQRKAATEPLPPGLAERIRRCFGES